MTSLDLFRDVIDLVEFPQGAVIFEKGDPGDVMYLIKEGEVDITNGKDVLTTLPAGELLGEMALISNEPRSATAVARTDCRMLPVDEAKFLYLVQQTPYFALHVMGLLTDRLRRAIDVIST